MVPKNHDEILAALHDGIAGEHLGKDKTFSRVSKQFYWPGYWTDTNNCCQTCVSCATRKPPSRTKRAPLSTILASTKLWPQTF